MAREDVQLKFRVPGPLKMILERDAEQNKRSLNAEITSRLEFSTYAHPHAYLLRALIELHEQLLYGKEEVEVPPHLQDELRRVANERGLSAQKLLVRLVIEALDALDNKTDLGKEIEQRIRQYEDEVAPDAPDDD